MRRVMVLIAYWTAYLKAHYPDAFMAALMTSDHDDIDRLAIKITECKHMGMEVLSPDVNQSYVEFAVVPAAKQVRFGMAAVKGVGVGAVEEIIRARDAGGPFKSVEDFAKRVSTSMAQLGKCARATARQAAGRVAPGSAKICLEFDLTQRRTLTAAPHAKAYSGHAPSTLPRSTALDSGLAASDERGWRASCRRTPAWRFSSTASASL